ncbi:MAG: hypothetical protein AMXMBFR64_47890 [Myxococcales bacterium]
MSTADRLRVLLADLAADQGALEHHAETIRCCLESLPWEPDAPVLSVVAVALHHWYGAAESAMERVIRSFEGLPAQDSRWHQRILELSTREIPEVRPAILSPETADGLRDLLAFRHFFRHAYAISLSPVKLAANARALADTHPRLVADLAQLERVVRAGIAAADR